jgi:hypothetical protein
VILARTTLTLQAEDVKQLREIVELELLKHIGCVAPSTVIARHGFETHAELFTM